MKAPIKQIKKGEIKGATELLRREGPRVAEFLTEQTMRQMHAETVSFDHFGYLVEMALELMQVPQGACAAEHSDVLVDISRHLDTEGLGGLPPLELARKLAMDPENVMKFVLRGQRSDVCAALAYRGLMGTVSLLENSLVERAIQQMSLAAFFLARATAARVSEDASFAAAKGPSKRLESTPLQAVKEQIKKRYLDWKAGKSTYKSGADFARKMDVQFPGQVGGGPMTIKNWVWTWDKERRSQK